MAKGRTKATAEVIDFDQLEKELIAEYGTEVISSGANIKAPSLIPTGVFSIDKVLGGGVPQKRITEIYGPPGSAKTALTLSLIASAQQLGGRAVFIDAERTFEEPWARKNGVDVDLLTVVTPTTGEDAYHILLQYLKAEVDIIVLDSIANVVPSAELEGHIADAHIGLAARLNAKAMRKITNENKKTAVILVNQIRQNVTTGPFHGNPETTTGGKAIPFYSSLRLNLRKISRIETGGEITGANYRVKVEKAKTGSAGIHQVAEFQVDFTDGIDIANDLLKHAMSKGLVSKAGSWFTVGEKRLQGEAATKQYMKTEGLIDIWRKEFTDENT